MNKKLIAAAVSAAVVAPVTAYGEASFYGRVNNAIDINDLADGGDSTTDVSGVSSRFGFKYSGDIGNGLTAHGRYEFATTTDKEGPGVNDTRIATVGLSGAFGRVDVGNQWSSYFNTFGTLVSPTYSLGYYLYSSVGGAPFRSSNTIKYSNSFGPLSAQLDVRLNDSEEGSAAAEKIRGEGIGLGLSFAVSDNITIAAAFDNEEGASRSAIEAVSSIAERGNPAMPAMPGTDLIAAHPATAAEARDAVAPYNLLDPVDYQVVEGVAGVDAIVEGANIPEVDATPATPATHADADYAPRVNGVAAQPADDAPDTDRVGLGIKASFGGYWASLGWQNYEVDQDDRTGAEVDTDTTFLYGGGNLGEKTNWLIGYSEANDGRDAVAAVGNTVLNAAQVAAINADLADGVAPVAEGDRLDDGTDAVPGTDDSSQLTWGIYHNFGGGLKVYYEGTSVDSENAGYDGTVHLLGMRVDF